MKKGNKVVCIDDTIRASNDVHTKYFQNWIVKDREYTIREVSGNLSGTKSLLLVGVKNRVQEIEGLFGKAEPRFAIERFKKLDILEESVEKEEYIEVSI